MNRLTSLYRSIPLPSVTLPRILNPLSATTSSTASSKTSSSHSSSPSFPSSASIATQRASSSTNALGGWTGSLGLPLRWWRPMGLRDVPGQLEQSSRTHWVEGVDVAQYMVASHYVPPRHTIVLCHGLFGYDKIDIGPPFMPLEFHYWPGIRQGLEKLGARVVVARVPRCGSVEERAAALKAYIEQVCPGERVNLVAHSMGGLDSRYMLTHLKPDKFTVGSLTTLSTPHRGSPFMDRCRDVFGVGRLNAEETTYFQRLFSVLDVPAYKNLTTEYLASFNPQTPNVEGVSYYSVGAAYPVSAWSPLRIPFEITSKAEGPNDGLVSIESAKWGKYLGTVHCDHWDLVNTWGVVGKWVHFDAVHLYLEVATKLNRDGH